MNNADQTTKGDFREENAKVSFQHLKRTRGYASNYGRRNLTAVIIKCLFLRRIDNKHEIREGKNELKEQFLFRSSYNLRKQFLFETELLKYTL